MKQSQSNSHLFGGNAAYVEELYEDYLSDPTQVSQAWRQYFDALQAVPAVNGGAQADVAHTPIIESFARRTYSNAANSAGTVSPAAAKASASPSPDVQPVPDRSSVSETTSSGSTAAVAATPAGSAPAAGTRAPGAKQASVEALINGYRALGGRRARLDPLQRLELPSIPELDPKAYGLSESDLDLEFNAKNLCFGYDNASLRQILQDLAATYCGTIGAEYAYLTNTDENHWWRERLESTRSKPPVSPEKKLRILERLTAAEGLERYLHTKFVGQKRFSLEGGESFIVSMDALVSQAARHGVQDLVIGMAHRGRLNVLVNTLGKTPANLFAEFEGKYPSDLPAGDVKYHKGYSSDVSTAHGPIHLALAFNPSHLEIVNPVVVGSARARMDRRGDKLGREVLGVQVHGDSAFAGQGVVMETLNLSQTRGYGTGGTVHIVINNQIGFTTSDPRDMRSTLYCTDIAKMIEAPVLHVNGDDPEAVAFATELAVDFRTTFHKDVIVDIVCFRKLGHNEQDTPAVTQPLMYKKVTQHPGTRAVYGQQLVDEKALSQDDVDQLAKTFRTAMEEGRHTVDFAATHFKRDHAVDWTPFLGRAWSDDADTRVPLNELKALGTSISTVPESVKPHTLVARVLNDRAAMARGEKPLDWGMGEHLAFASLLKEGYGVRVSGQDSGRGTFSHRHAVVHDQNRANRDDEVYIPLEHVAKDQAVFSVIDSVLSEEAVLGFEYGYSTSEPNTLAIWEAQFGDFVNGAQVVIDQFISSGEVKWGRVSGLTMLLPHGYEGQGPEHSSARMERFLQLCADANMQVVQPSSPAQIFHLLRRQMTRELRKPLIVFTPKSLLRHKEATNSLEELANGTFEPVLGDQHAGLDAKAVKRALVCSGRVYYDLVARRREEQADNVAIIRIEQLYPFSREQFAAQLAKYPNLTEVVWVQDEPKNQGPWSYIQDCLLEELAAHQALFYSGRPSSASPAVGYASRHQEQQRELVERAFGPLLRGPRG